MNRRVKIIFILSASLALFLWYFMDHSFRPNAPQDIQNLMENLASKERCFALTQGQIDALRPIPVHWHPGFENGMAWLDLESFSKQIHEAFPSNPNKLDLEAAFQIFLRFGEMAPGDYPLGVGDVVDDGAATSNNLTIQKNIEFSMSPQHLKLLRRANGRWADYGGLLIDPKRPYGDMTHFELDMADILGIPLETDDQGYRKPSEEQQKIFAKLFLDLPYSLRAFLKNATISPGEFCQKPAGWGHWRRVETNPLKPKS